MKVFTKIGQGVNLVGGGIVKTGFHLTGGLIETKFPKSGRYIKEVGNTVVHSSQSVISNVSQFADGTATGIYGVATKDGLKSEEGWDDVKTATSNTTKGLVNGVVYTGKSIGQTVKGAIQQDNEMMLGGLGNVGKAVVVTTLGIGVIDMMDIGVVHADEMEMETRNAQLEGSTHEVTGVEFERQVYSTDTNGVYSGVFPNFDAAFDARLPEDTYGMSDELHIRMANLQLYEAIQENPSLADELGFIPQDIENLNSSVTPPGYDWHHHEEAGRMQLVNEQQHSLTGHTGGRNIWGGGTEAR